MHVNEANPYCIFTHHLHKILLLRKVIKLNSTRKLDLQINQPLVIFLMYLRYDSCTEFLQLP